MTGQIVPTIADRAPALVASGGERASCRFFEFFVANIRNPNTRRAYARAVWDFLAWCEGEGAASLAEVKPLYVGAYVELLTRDRLRDCHVARLVKRAARAAGVRPDLTEAERKEKFAGHSLRAGLASSADVDERYVQKQLATSALK